MLRSILRPLTLAVILVKRVVWKSEWLWSEGMEHDFNRYEQQFLTPRHYSAWDLIKSYWQSDRRGSAYLGLSVVVMMTIGLVGFEVVLNFWYNYFYNALQAYNKNAVINLLVIFFMLAGLYMVLAVYRFYISQLLEVRWRNWLTQQFLGLWLQKRGYYYLENFDDKTDNPDQRIQEDIGSLVASSIDLALGIVGAITTIMAFVYVLWRLSGQLVIPLGSFGTLSISGYLVWVGLIYSLIGTLFTFKIGYPLVALNFEQQRREATFRFAAMDLRAHAEHVALYRGEEHQNSILHRLFSRVLDNWYLIILRQKLLLWFTAGYNQTSVVLPLVVALPNYFNKVFMLGGLMQTLGAFNRVQDSLSFLVNSYNQIAVWRAVVRRLTTFVNHLHEIEVRAEEAQHLNFLQTDLPQVITAKLNISTPRNEPLLKNINETFTLGKNYLIKGESGIGKSTFIRTLAGIWPFAAGQITFPTKPRVMFLPQKPYMPLGTLEEAILFPDHKDATLGKKLIAVLEECKLGQFVPRLQEVANWTEQLSPGEQQRVALARILLHEPDWVFLDESTSMLDLKNETYFYQLLKRKLPHASLISVGHRASLDQLHDHIIDMAKYT